MSRPTIAVDIDDVLAASAPEFINFSNQQWGTNLKLEDYHEDWATMWQVDRLVESQRARVIYQSQVIGGFPHDTAALAVLKQLKPYFKLVIATSRVYKIHQETINWLNQYFEGVFEAVHYSRIFDSIAEGVLKNDGAHKLSKANLIQEIGAGFLIDDQPKHCLAVAEAGIEAILFGAYPWNTGISSLPSHVTRCPDWPAVGEYFNART